MVSANGGIFSFVRVRSGGHAIKLVKLRRRLHPARHTHRDLRSQQQGDNCRTAHHLTKTPSPRTHFSHSRAHRERERRAHREREKERLILAYIRGREGWRGGERESSPRPPFNMLHAAGGREGGREEKSRQVSGTDRGFCSLTCYIYTLLIRR